MGNKPKILYVDDEPINLGSFKATFKNDFEVLTATSGEEGLELFCEHAGAGLAVVISDQRMPGMSGVDFLAKVLGEDPTPIRIILTAYADFHNVSEAINKGKIFQFVQKPWDYKTFKPLLHRAIEVYSLAKDNQSLLKELAESNRKLLSANSSLEEELSKRKREEKLRRNAEIMMLSQAKLASLGEMATGIAHEINQPLTYIQVILQAARKDLTDDSLNFDEFMGEIDESLRQVSRITTIIDHLRTFGRVDHMEFAPVDLHSVINDTLISLRQRIKLENIDLVLELSDGLPEVSGIATQLEQILVNLIINAIDALEGCPKKHLIIRLKIADGQNIIEVEDNGSGVREEDLGKIFEPFFTTKEVGKGTGVGLSIVYGIVREHGGTIGCKSNLGAGVVFTLSLPHLAEE
jgi:C4-dicarboxylate-specific signal transduction histidine kinase